MRPRGRTVQNWCLLAATIIGFASGLGTGLAASPGGGPDRPHPNGCQHHGGFAWRQSYGDPVLVLYGCKDGHTGTVDP